MTVWVVTEDDFHGGEIITGVYASRQAAEAAHRGRKVAITDYLVEGEVDMRAACEAVIGHGYHELKGASASQDYVSKKAIAKVRAALAKANATQHG